jgi:hypothetical protein
MRILHFFYHKSTQSSQRRSVGASLFLSAQRRRVGTSLALGIKICATSLCTIVRFCGKNHTTHYKMTPNDEYEYYLDFVQISATISP